MAQDASNTSYNVLWFFDNYNDFRNWQKIYTDSVSLLSPSYIWYEITLLTQITAKVEKTIKNFIYSPLLSKE